MESITFDAQSGFIHGSIRHACPKESIVDDDRVIRLSALYAAVPQPVADREKPRLSSK
jgi:hypothetical protein